jgi:selenide,water dikinase
LADFNPPTHPDLLVDIKTKDDAGVYRLNEEQAIIQTLDFFTPMVDDPYLFGQIAAVNALNDVYAMGGKPLLAMNIVCFPACEDVKVLRQILEGGLSKIVEAGALLVGGHTVDDNEPKYGLSVTGLVHPAQLKDNAGARVGDSIFLTKPIGNGIIATAIKGEVAAPDAYNEAVYWMSMLNKEAAEAINQVEIHALTDVTGFGLIGHLSEMAEASDVEIELYTKQVPLITGALEYAQMGLIPAGTYKNRNYLNQKIDLEDTATSAVIDIMFSPETAGGLLIAISEAKELELIAALQDKQCCCQKIGRVLRKGFKPIRII